MIYFSRLFIRMSFFVFLLSIWGTSPSIITSPRLDELLNDMQLYKLDSEGDPYLHAGDLYEHSIWTYNAMIELFKGDLPYVQNLNLTGRQQEVVALAALLHDVGKAGRKELFDKSHPTLHYNIRINADGAASDIIYYQDHQEHPRISFAYAMLQKEYYAIHHNNGSLYVFDFGALYTELGITKEEQKTIAILLGIHYEFGNLKHNKITPEQFLDKLEDLVKIVDYNNGELNELVVRLAILIQVADVKGLMPVAAQKTPLFPDGITRKQIHQPTKFADTFTQLGYSNKGDCCCGTEPIAVTTMNELIAAFRAKAQKITPVYQTLEVYA